MKALVLAAGHGTRLRPLTDDRPKPMVEVAGRPLVDYLLCWLADQGVRDVAINLHHAPAPLQEHVGDGRRFGVRVQYSHEPELLGSAGALVPLRGFFEGEDFVVVYGDVLTSLDLGTLVSRHLTSDADATVAVTTVDDPTLCGVVAFDQDGWISRFVEKPARQDAFSSWGNAGIYACSPRVFHALPDPCPVPYDFASQLFPSMLQRGARLLAVTTDAPVIDIGSVGRLDRAADAVRSGALVGSRC